MKLTKKQIKTVLDLMEWADASYGALSEDDEELRALLVAGLDTQQDIDFEKNGSLV
jgi:hypothetical protein